MGDRRRRPKLVLTPEGRRSLEELTRSRTAPAAQLERARMLLAYADGQRVSDIARVFHTTRPTVERCLDKALELGPTAALKDLPGRGRKAQIPAEARAWVVSLACQKPKDLGYPHEMWTTALLRQHVQVHCEAAHHPELRRLGRGTVSKILRRSQVRPHKISYYLERRDPDFEEKMAQVLCVYREVQALRAAGGSALVAVLSYDEKPGIQALGGTAPDRPPIPGVKPNLQREFEYVRHGTLTLMAGIDLLNGQIWGQVVERRRSREFVAFLRRIDAAYPAEAKIRIVLDNHSAHVSRETRAFLATRPNRFEFVFTPKHGSWLNLIESFFGKLARTVLRGIRVDSKDELKRRIEQHLAELNEAPVVFHWRYKLDADAVV
jgi:transposase